MSKKKIIGGAAILLVLALAVAGWAVADEAAETWSCFRKGPECAIERIDKVAAELDLNADQQAKLEALKKEMLDRITLHRSKHLRFTEEVKAQLKSDKPDMKALSAMIKTKMNEALATAGTGLDKFVEFYETLDDKQQDKILGHFREKMEWLDKHHHDRPWAKKQAG